MGVFEDYAGDNYNREFVEDYLLQRYPGFVCFVESIFESIYRLKGVVKVSDYDVAKEVFKGCEVLARDEILKDLGIVPWYMDL